MRSERIDTPSEAEASFVNALTAQSITTTGGRDAASQLTSTGGDGLVDVASTGGSRPMDGASSVGVTTTTSHHRVPLCAYYDDDDEMPPHFEVLASAASRRRRMPAAVAAAIRRRLSRARASAAERERELSTDPVSEGPTPMATAEATMVTATATAGHDSEFGTGFLNVDSVPGSGSLSEGCVEAAEAVMTARAHEDAASTISSSGGSASLADATGATHSTSNFVRLVSRARRALRPLSVRGTTISRSATGTASATTLSFGGRTRSTKTQNRGVIIPPAGITLEEFTLDGEKRIGLCREPSKADLCEEFQMMKERFPDVPKFAGNPPWLTRFHPDLIRPPTTLSVGRTVQI